MRLSTAILLATPVALGLVALIVRGGAPPVSRPAAKADIVSTEPRRAPEEAGKSEASSEKELDRRSRRVEERERVVERLLANYEDRITRLIESIDWTRAESRVRFPIEYELIRAELAHVMSGLDGK
jgi:hypothetical protein